MKKILLLCLILFSCSPKGYWLTQDAYRAKRPNYQLAKKKFIQTNLLSTDFIYLSEDSLVSIDRTLKSAIGLQKEAKRFLIALMYQRLIWKI